MLVLAILLPFLHLSLAATYTYTLHHRLLSPTDPSTQFRSYGTITLGETDDQSTTATVRISKSGDAGSGVGGSTSGAWYQVLLSGEGLGEGIMTSTKACYLHAGPPSVVLHRHQDRISSIDLIPHASIPADGSCPPSSAGLLFNPILESEVIIKHPSTTFGPDLAPPIPVSTAPGGGPVAPPEEKSFLQKYWLPLLGVGFFVVSQLAPDDKPQQAGAGAGAAARR